MSTISVIEHLKKYNMEKRIITVSTSSATVKEAAEALGTEEARIAKTLSFKLKDKNILVTRLAHGLPMGSSLDYADDLTLIKALDNRRKIENE